MNRPLSGVPAIVLCPGPDLPTDKLSAFEPYFTIGVNSLWKLRPDYHPTVAFWLDQEGPLAYPEWYEYSLGVCDRSASVASVRAPVIEIPTYGCEPLPKYAQLDPHRLYQRPSAGVVAALWAISLGCWPVCGLGMGCEDDGRNPRQMAAMESARDDLEMAQYIPDGHWRYSFWRWTRAAVENPVVWSSYLTSPRMRNPGPGGASVQAILKQFYGE